MRSYVAVTDDEWFEFLRRRHDLDEVNFWQPGGNRRFRALQHGEPILFKLHSPRNFVVGGGFFAHSSLLPASTAWAAFGPKNGAGSFEAMLRRLAKYRHVPYSPRLDPTIGCIALVQPFFFDESDWIPIPGDFRLSIQQGKRYDMTQGEGARLWARASAALLVAPRDTVSENLVGGPMFGPPTLGRRRLGQGSFSMLITDTYQRQCALTGERALPVLDAAHILPVAEGGRHEVGNGLLLRSDVHRLFDRGYVSVTPDHRILVSRRLKDDFDNGEPYYPLVGKKIWFPKSLDARPRREFLEWHSDEKFLR